MSGPDIRPSGPDTLGPVRIRQATPEDLERVVAFNQAIGAETEGRKLDPARLRQGVRALLGDASLGRYLVAEVDGVVAGQMMITFEWSDWRNAPVWWIQSVYVDAAYRRRGVYRALHAHVREQARREGGAGLRLYVDRDNAAARATYRALGMVPSRYEMFEEMWGATDATADPDAAEDAGGTDQAARDNR